MPKGILLLGNLVCVLRRLKLNYFKPIVVNSTVLTYGDSIKLAKCTEKSMLHIIMCLDLSLEFPEMRMADHVVRQACL